MIDNRTFCRRFTIRDAVVVAAIITVLGLFFGRVVESTLAEEIGKRIVMSLFIIGIFEVFAYVLAPLSYSYVL